jgi:hypothetical protein
MTPDPDEATPPGGQRAGYPLRPSGWVSRPAAHTRPPGPNHPAYATWAREVRAAWATVGVEVRDVGDLPTPAASPATRSDVESVVVAVGARRRAYHWPGHPALRALAGPCGCAACSADAA